MTNFNYQRALVIGGSSGIGFAVAKQLLEAGLSVSIIGNNGKKLCINSNKNMRTSL